MSNFIETYKRGKAGLNMGLPTGIKGLDKAINGLQKKVSIGLAAPPKVGKTKLADYSFVINPYLHYERLGKLDEIEWIYHSYEIDRVSKEFNFAAFFMAMDHNVYHIKYKGKTYDMCGSYLEGELLHENTDGTLEFVPVAEEHEAMLKEIYDRRIIPMFGEYSEEGVQITKGKITFIEEPENPTGIYNFLLHHAGENGVFRYHQYETKDDAGKTVVRRRMVGYTPNNPNKFTIVITDHIRKLRRERNFSMKENIDKFLEYSTIIRNLTWYSFIHVIHSNRQLSNVDRMKFSGEFIFPTADDCKDSGNPAEECTIFMTLFHPNDEKYNIKKHFGHDLQQYPNYRSIHITESRKTKSPMHIFVNMYGGIGFFEPINNSQKV